MTEVAEESTVEAAESPSVGQIADLSRSNALPSSEQTFHSNKSPSTTDANGSLTGFSEEAAALECINTCIAFVEKGSVEPVPSNGEALDEDSREKLTPINDASTDGKTRETVVTNAETEKEESCEKLTPINGAGKTCETVVDDGENAKDPVEPFRALSPDESSDEGNDSSSRHSSPSAKIVQSPVVQSPMLQPVLPMAQLPKVQPEPPTAQSPKVQPEPQPNSLSRGSLLVPRVVLPRLNVILPRQSSNSNRSRKRSSASARVTKRRKLEKNAAQPQWEAEEAAEEAALTNDSADVDMSVQQVVGADISNSIATGTVFNYFGERMNSGSSSLVSDSLEGECFKQIETACSVVQFGPLSLADKYSIEAIVFVNCCMLADNNYYTYRKPFTSGDLELSEANLSAKLAMHNFKLSRDVVQNIGKSIEAQNVELRELRASIDANTKQFKESLTDYRRFTAEQLQKLCDHVGQSNQASSSSAIGTGEPNDSDQEEEEPDAEDVVKQKTKKPTKGKSTDKTLPQIDFSEIKAVKTEVARQNVVGVEAQSKRFIWKLANECLTPAELATLAGKGLTAGTKVNRIKTEKQLLDLQCNAGRRVLEATIRAYGYPKDATRMDHLLCLIAHLKNHMNIRNFKKK